MSPPPYRKREPRRSSRDRESPIRTRRFRFGSWRDRDEPAGVPMTLGDLIRDGRTLKGTCGSCKRSKGIDPAKLRLPPETTIEAVERKLKCQECDDHTVRLLVVPRPATDAEVMADPAVKAIVEAFPAAKVTITNRKDEP